MSGSLTHSGASRMSNSPPEPVSLQTCIFMLREALFAIDRGDVADAREWIASLTRNLTVDEGIYEFFEARDEHGNHYVEQ